MNFCRPDATPFEQFNEEVLLSATRHNRPEVLQWWYNSGLTVHYRICDIEEALEDAIRPGLQAREWWSKLGVDFKANNAEWMKLKTLRRVFRCNIFIPSWLI